MHPLFDGDPVIAGMTPGTRFVVHRPTVHDRPVLAAGDDPIDALGVSYACVLHDGGRYRMWYQAWPRDWDGRDVLQSALAESDDGLTWRRCDCGLVERDGSRHNALTDLPMHCQNVIIQHSAPADQRYRVFGYFAPRGVAGREGDFTHMEGYCGYATATSADGVHWPPQTVQPLWKQMDVLTAAGMADGSVLLMMKGNRILRGQLRRTFYSARWDHGRMSTPAEALWPDETDDMLARARGLVAADYYGVGLEPGQHGSATGFLWNFRHAHPLGHAKHHHLTWGDAGTVDITLVRRFVEGGGWHHLPGRPVWLGAEHVPDWAAGALYTSPRTVRVGDESFLYFTGTRDFHGWAGPGTGYDAYMRSTIGHGGFARIGLTRWPIDRLAGIHAVHPEHLYLRAVPLAGQTLHLNFAARPSGHIRAALVDASTHEPIEGFSLRESRALAGDHVAAAVHWGQTSHLPDAWRGREVLLQIEFQDATVWAFDLANA